LRIISHEGVPPSPPEGTPPASLLPASALRTCSRQADAQVVQPSKHWPQLPPAQDAIRARQLFSTHVAQAGPRIATWAEVQVPASVELAWLPPASRPVAPSGPPLGEHAAIAATKHPTTPSYRIVFIVILLEQIGNRLISSPLRPLSSIWPS
jgi:hypothetical protein